MYNVLAAATNHPDPINPYYGLFNARSIVAVRESDVAVNVVSPRPFAPPFGPYSEFRDIPAISRYDGYQVHHPRFFYGVPKRLFYGLSGRSYAKRVPSYVEHQFETPDIVHGYHIYPDGYGMRRYCRQHDVPLVVVSHGEALNEFDSFSDSVQSKIVETLEVSDRVLCVSEALAQRARMIAPQVDIEVVPIGASPSDYPTENEEEIRGRMGIPLEKPVVLFCGQFIARKGLKEIIEVLPSLAETSAQYLFVGQDGEMRTLLEEAIEKEEMGEMASVRYDVRDEFLRRCFVVADLLLLPSHSEGRPTVIYEAMASRTAVLAANVGGVSEQVAEDDTGVLIPPQDQDRLEESLKTLLSDVETLDSMGRLAHKRLDEKGWTWDEHGERVKDIYKRVLEQR